MVDFKSIFIVILLIIFVILLLFVIFWDQVKQTVSNDSETVSPLESPVGFDYRCGSEFQCTPGTSCDSITATCKRDNNQPCNIANDCLNGAYCSGLCLNLTSNPPALISQKSGDPCPCPSTMSCVLGNNSINICKLNSGQNCNSDDQCISSLCNQGRCANTKPNGERCNTDFECSSGNCSVSNQGTFCQPRGINNGNLGATCNRNEMPGCNDQFTCFNNVCVLSTNGLNAPCNTSTQACHNPLVCLNVPSMAPCTPGNTECTCQYPASAAGGIFRPNPNSCADTGVCSNFGYLCLGEFCRADTGIACVNNGDCQSSFCQSPGGVYILVYEYYNRQGKFTFDNNPENILGSVTIAPQNSSFGKPPDNVVNLIGFSSDSTDSVFYVSLGNRDFPDQTGVIRTDGVNFVQGFLDRNFNQITLKDATAYNDGRFLVVYDSLADGIRNDTLYVAVRGQFPVPFNQANNEDDPRGTQYFNGVKITPIDSVSVNPSGDTSITSNGNLFLLPGTSNTWILARANVQNVSFYTNPPPSINDYAYVGPYSDQNGSRGNLLQFNGSLGTAVYPVLSFVTGSGDNRVIVTYDSYQVYDYSTYSGTMGLSTDGYTLIVANNNNNQRVNLFVVVFGVQRAIPAYVSFQTKVLALRFGAYFYSPRSCNS